MTIYKASLIEKKPDSESKEPEVVTEPLTGFKDDAEATSAPATARVVRVNYASVRSYRTRTMWAKVLVCLIICIILALGAAGGIFLYRHFQKVRQRPVYSGVCGNTYFDPQYHQQQGDMPVEDSFVESFEVSDILMYEHLEIPQFDEVPENAVWHDFTLNYTAIVDHGWRRCYIMKLNRTMVMPPKDLIEFIERLKSGYYLPKAQVIRENYRMVYPPISLRELRHLSYLVSQQCEKYQTFRLEKIVSGVFKRDTNKVTEGSVVYAIPNNNMNSPIIFKLIVNNAGTRALAGLL